MRIAFGDTRIYLRAGVVGTPDEPVRGLYVGFYRRLGTIHEWSRIMVIGWRTGHGPVFHFTNPIGNRP